jgi:hypothetical protein
LPLLLTTRPVAILSVLRPANPVGLKQIPVPVPVSLKNKTEAFLLKPLSAYTNDPSSYPN